MNDQTPILDDQTDDGDELLPRRELLDRIDAAIEAGDVELCDRLGRAHADQIIRQIQHFLARDERQPVTL